MKRLSYIFFTTIIIHISFITTANSQYVYIPDSAFRSFLNNNGFGTAMNGDSLDTTASSVSAATVINCSGLTIQSLEGIQYFHQLNELNCSVNYLTTLPQLSDSVQVLDCSKNLITTLPALPVDLTFLSCYNNQLSALPALPFNLNTLDCSVNRISSLPNLPSALISLDCDSNLISSLPVLPAQLNRLYSAYNLLDSLPQLPSTLRDLDCSGNTISALPPLPDTLLFLNICFNDFYSLPPTLPSQLNSLFCTMNHIDSIVSLPSSLAMLYVDYNQLRTLPPLPGLSYLVAGHNLLSVLPPLPSTLTVLAADHNFLDSLPLLPSTIIHFEVSNNYLDTLLPLPPGLKSLGCSYNSLNHLPEFPSSLVFLNCDSNMIQVLPDLPDTMRMVSIRNNPITCFPPLKKTYALLWDSTYISCFPNYIEIVEGSFPDIRNVPLCQPSSGCEISWSIEGKVFHDLNNDCIQDSLEQNLHDIPVYLDSAGIHLQSVTTNAEGHYYFRAPLGTYQVSINPASVAGSITCPVSGMYTINLNTSDSLEDSLNFAMECPDGFDLVSNSVTPMSMFRPTRLVEVRIVAGDIFGKFGTACYDSAGFINCNFSGPISYVGPAPGALIPVLTSAQSLRWNINDFSFTDPTTSFNIEVRVDSFASIQSDICFEVGAYPFTGDIRPLNNFTTFCYPVQNSFDPNEKLMVPSGSVDTSDQVFNFTVFFQNTGNAPAEDIYIIDTLDSDLDVSTIEFLSSSHPVITQMLPGNIIRFNFPMINLPDSNSNETLSHGLVQYSIRRSALTGMGTEITNTAYIYFDQNPPIATNTVYAVITSLVSVNSDPVIEKLHLYPNPAGNSISISNLNTAGGTINIINLLGEKIVSYEIKEQKYELNISDLTPGVYIIEQMNKYGRRAGKFIKQ